MKALRGKLLKLFVVVSLIAPLGAYAKSKQEKNIDGLYKDIERLEDDSKDIQKKLTSFANKMKSGNNSTTTSNAKEFRRLIKDNRDEIVDDLNDIAEAEGKINWSDTSSMRCKDIENWSEDLAKSAENGGFALVINYENTAEEIFNTLSKIDTSSPEAAYEDLKPILEEGRTYLTTLHDSVADHLNSLHSQLNCDN